MDRRIVLAILLMMAIAIAPAAFMKRPVPPPPVTADSVVVGGPEAVRPTLPATTTPATLGTQDSVVSPAEDTIRVMSALYTYAFSTRGGRLIEATLHQYRSMMPSERARGEDAQIFQPDGDFLALTLVSGRDSLPLRDWTFSPSATTVNVESGPTPLTLTAEREGVRVELTYTFVPEQYRMTASGRVVGLGPNGGVVVVGLGPGLRNTESDSLEHFNILGVVTKATKTTATRIASLDLGEIQSLTGPFDWVAVKSKYFVAGLFAFDTLSAEPGIIGGVQVLATDSIRKNPAGARILATLPVTGAGDLGFTVYAGPMEFSALSSVGRDFDDVNPYGWPGLRTLIRPVAGGARWLLVWVHRNLGISYGFVLILFGITIRIVLWPLNQKAMRSSMAMQAIQPLMKEVQDKHKQDPQKMQQEVFKLYKEHNVNPMGGCWPMLVPMPILFALFFVFQNTIELRGAPFLWLTDLSRADPLYIIPVVMGISMFGLSKIGQLGVAPSPQMKMMLYVLPVMMTVLFLNFASGLNLYYAVQNLASIPQQWLLAQERVKGQPPPAPPTSPKKATGKTKRLSGSA